MIRYDYRILELLIVTHSYSIYLVLYIEYSIYRGMAWNDMEWHDPLWGSPLTWPIVSWIPSVASAGWKMQHSEAAVKS